MALSVVGVNHQTCPVVLRERLAVLGAASVREALAAAGWREVVVLSTCNRFEVYAASERSPQETGAALQEFLGAHAGTETATYLYEHHDDAAARHLFSVAAGLDSLVLGECDIINQVKSAYEAALESGTTAKLTNVLFQRALFVGKAVRSRTGISLGQVSTASVAVEMARRIFGELSGSRALVLGAGEMAERTARHLLSAKVAGLHIANRTWERAAALAASLRADPVRWEAFPRLLSKVDVVVSSTGAAEPVLTRAMVREALNQRGGRSMFLIDIAMPRDIEAGTEDLDGAYLYTLADLAGLAQENADRRKGEFAAAGPLVDEASRDFGAWLESVRLGREVSLRHSGLRPLGAAASLRPA
ncbi:MAG: glutamyl-tRNA reductase [Elusimicrobia bacterium]|nr:glutamyl-tRNA reductase [Elusimicrobiota bacterium]